jgi:carbonic anhydrase
MRQPFLTAAIAPLTLGLLAAAEEKAHPWSYAGATGPSHWGGTCQAGKAQSPINVRTVNAERKALPALEFHYRPSALHIVDNGHTVQVRVSNGSTLSVGGAHFSLVQFHFHKPSEEAIDGRRFDMVAHLVHKNAAGKLAVVAVPLKAGADNPAIAKAWRYLPREQGREVSPAGVTIDPTKLLPSNRAYFTYEGSLTTPPCTEGVRWFVLRSPTTITPGEIKAFAKSYPSNARPVQPANGREILASK